MSYIRTSPHQTWCTNKDCLILLLIAVTWVLAEALISPFGNFAMNDDFFYSKPLKALVEEGKWLPVEIASPNAFTQIVWAYIFCIPFGFSLTAAKISTLTAASIGSFLFYFILRKLNISEWPAFGSVLLLILNPLFLPLSNTFMTDIPFLTLFLAAFYFYLIALEKHSSSAVVIGTIFSLLAALNRQFGVTLPLAFGLAYLAYNRKFSINTIFVSLMPILIVSLALLTYIAWITGNGNDFEPLIIKLSNTPSVFSRGIPHLFARTAFISLSSMVYLGIFFSPLILWKLNGIIKPRKKIMPVTIFLFLYTLTAYAVLAYARRLMPLLPNNIINFGIGPGPVLLRDGGLFWPAAPAFVWHLITISGLYLSAVLIYIFSRALTQAVSAKSDFFALPQHAVLLLVFFTLAYLPLISLIGPFDRYVIPLYPVCLMLLLTYKRDQADKPGFIVRSLTGIAATLLFYFTICGTHDLFSLYNAKMQAINFLQNEKGILETQIDGGLEFNGWPTDWNVQARTKSSSWWNVKDDKYVVTLGLLEGYSIIRQFEFQRWMFMDKGSIYVLEKSLP